MRLLSLLILTSLSTPCQARDTPAADSLVIPPGTRQLVVVKTNTWETTSGALQRFERNGESWAPVSEPVPVVLGRSGLGWGVGLHPKQWGGPDKVEGDGRAPAGVFALTETFGYAEAEPTGLPYLHATQDIECVDDSDSGFYNRVLNRRDVDVDWTSHEEMRRRDDLYRLGIVVAHNEAAVPRGGSCIFLHIWRDPASTTSGCTAMASSVMQEVAAWLDGSARPLLVQLPQAEYERLRIPWGLP